MNTVKSETYLALSAVRHEGRMELGLMTDLASDSCHVSASGCFRGPHRQLAEGSEHQEGILLQGAFHLELGSG